MQEEMPMPPDAASGLEAAISNMEAVGTPMLIYGLVAGIVIGYAIAYLQHAKKK